MGDIPYKKYNNEGQKPVKCFLTVFIVKSAQNSIKKHHKNLKISTFNFLYSIIINLILCGK